jgi:hypothetical protein
MEIKCFAGRLLLVSVFVFVGYSLLTSPQSVNPKLYKLTVTLNLVLKEMVGVSLPLDDIKLNSKVVLQVIGALAIIGAIGAVQRHRVGVGLLVLLTLLCALAELSLLWTEQSQRGGHLLSLMKSLGVLGGLVLLGAQRDAAPKPEASA